MVAALTTEYERCKVVVLVLNRHSRPLRFHGLSTSLKYLERNAAVPSASIRFNSCLRSAPTGSMGSIRLVEMYW